MNTANIIDDLLTERGWTARQLAAALDCSEASVSQWLAGAHEPRGELRARLIKLGAALEPDERPVRWRVLDAVREAPGLGATDLGAALKLAPDKVQSALRDLRRQGLVRAPSGDGLAWPTTTAAG